MTTYYNSIKTFLDQYEVAIDLISPIMNLNFKILNSEIFQRNSYQSFLRQNSKSYEAYFSEPVVKFDLAKQILFKNKLKQVTSVKVIKYI